MAETSTVYENSSVSLSNNNNNHESNKDKSDNSQLNNAEPKSISNKTNESFEPSMQTETNHSTFNQSSDHMNNAMSRLSMHGNRSNSNRFRPHSNTSYHNQSSSQFNSFVNQSDAHAQLIAFTPPLMSIRIPYQETQRHQRNYHSTRSYIPNQQTFLPPSETKSETTTSQPEYYVDSFSANFSDKPLSNSNNKTKTKHVTFQEPDIINESSTTNSNNIVFSSSSSNDLYNPSSNWAPPVYMYPNPHSFNQYNHPSNYYSYNNEYYPQYPNMMMNPRFMGRSRGMNMMSTRHVWTPPVYYPNQRMPYFPQSIRPKQLYDPNQPKVPLIIESQDSSKVLRNIVPKNKKKTKQIDSNDSSTVSTPEPISHPITILRKPSIDPDTTTSSVENQSITPSNDEKQKSITPSNDEKQQSTNSFKEEQIIITSEEEPLPITSSDIPSKVEQITTNNQSETNPTISLPSHELLSILQSANCISSLNEYAQQKKFPVNYEFSSTSPSLFTCIISINNRQFPNSSSCSSKNEAQKLACDQAVRILYRESCSIEQSSLEFSSKHDYIAHRSVSSFQDLNVNELLLGRKTLSCILMVTNQQFSQAQVISIATGNSCLDETNLSYANDGTALHDCHAEILARRGLIKYFFEQIKQSKDENSSIFEYNSTLNKYQLHDNITFHMYISTLPCGNASLNISSNSIRYKQGQIEGTLIASTSSIKYPIKSCSDKIYRWNILGIQGGLLINLLTKPIYLESITIACETTFDRNRVNYSLVENLKEYFHSLPSPYLHHMPDIDCPKMKSFQKERQVAKLQMNAFAWNISQSNRTELLEPRTGKLKNDRSISSLSKKNLFQDFLNIFQDDSLTYQQAKQLDKTYIMVKNLISKAFQTGSSDENITWISKSDQLEQFTIQ